MDLLINNAEVGSPELFVEQDPPALSRQIQLNVASLVVLSAPYLPGMLTRQRRGGERGLHRGLPAGSLHGRVRHDEGVRPVVE